MPPNHSREPRLEKNDAYAGGWVLIDEGDNSRLSIGLIRQLAAATRATENPGDASRGRRADMSQADVIAALLLLAGMLGGLYWARH